MTDTAKATLWVIIILILAVIAWSFFGGSPEVQTQVPEPVAQQATTTEPVAVEDASTTISLQDNGDEALQGDLNKIDDQLKAVTETVN